MDTHSSSKSSFSHNDVALFPKIYQPTESDDVSRDTLDSTARLQSIFKNGSSSRVQLQASYPSHLNSRGEVVELEIDEHFRSKPAITGHSIEGMGDATRVHGDDSANEGDLTDLADHTHSLGAREHNSHTLFKSYPSKISSFLHQFRHPQEEEHNVDYGTAIPLTSYPKPLDSLTLTSEIDLADLYKTGSGYSLDSSVLSAMAKGVDLDTHTGKFPYLAQYQALAKLKANLGEAELVFALSGLDDYLYYLRSTELDQVIGEQVKLRLVVGEENVLAIVDNSDLAQNYAPKDLDNFDGQRHRKLPKAKLPWSKFMEDRNAAGCRSVISELHHASEDVSSVDSRQSGVFLHRKLKVRHLQMISFGGTLGVGLYLNSGKAITIAGGLGTVLAFLIVGILVLAAISSFSEMVTFVSVVDGVSGLCSRFVDESFGFAAGWVYFISFSVGLAAELVACAILLSYFSETKILSSTVSTVGFVTLCFLFCVVSNMITVQVLGEIEYIASFFKVVATLIFIIVMIVINRGGMGENGVIGFKYWDYLKSDFAHNVIFGPMRPTFDLRSTGVSPETQGIGGDLGRFLSLLTAILIATYAYSGTEIVCIAACEAKDPRKALPKATKRVFWRILLFYCLASFLVSLNIYAGDPRLLRYYYGAAVSASDLEDNFAFHLVGGDKCLNSFKLFAGMGNGSQSPWSVAFQSAGLCNWSSVVNGVLFVFALSCGNSQLYASSRTIYALALQRKAPRFLRKCNRYGIPYYAVLVASCPALSAFICVSEKATVVFQNLTSLISSAGVIVWFSMCLAYIRFFFGLKKRPDIISREDKAYPYRSPFQPYMAMIGVFGSGFIILANGYVVFLKGCWNTMFFFSSYGTLILFALLYTGHRIVKGSSMLSLEALDYDSGKRETDIYIWDGGREYSRMKFRDLPHKVIDFVA